MKKIYSVFLFALFATLFASCSKDVSYYDAIPAQSRALVRVAPEAEGKGAAAVELFMGDGALGSDKAQCGVDFASPVYMFSAPDGNLGVCAKVSDSGKLDDILETMAKSGKASAVKEMKDCKFVVVNKLFLLGYNDEALMIMGPVLAADESRVAKRMMAYLEMNPERGIGASDIFKEIETTKNPIALTAAVSTMPKQLSVPFLIGTPTGTSSDDVLLKAEVTVADSTLTLVGRTSSTNVLVGQGIDNAMKILADGKTDEIIKVMEANKDLQSMLNNGSFREKLQKVNGRMLITMKTKDADVETLHGADKATLMKMVVDLKTFDKDVMKMFEPFLGGISTIVYEVR